MVKDQKRAFVDFYNSARKNKVLEPKTTLMIHLASAMALGCYPWMDHYLGVAKEEGLSDDEISTVQAIVMAVAAGKVNAQFREVRSKTENQSQPGMCSPQKDLVY